MTSVASISDTVQHIAREAVWYRILAQVPGRVRNTIYVQINELVQSQVYQVYTLLYTQVRSAGQRNLIVSPI